MTEREFLSLLRDYELTVTRYLPSSPDDDKLGVPEEVVHALTIRSEIQESLDGHTEWKEHLSDIRAVDEVLKSKAALVGKVLRYFGTRRDNRPSHHWWWYLGEKSGEKVA